MKRTARPPGLPLTRALRRELLAIPQVTEALLEAVWPSVEYIANQERRNSGSRLADFLVVVRAAYLRDADSAAAVHAVATDDQAAGLIGRVLFDVYGSGAGSLERAQAFLSQLAAEATQRERWYRAAAVRNSPKRGRAAEVSLHERVLTAELARVWISVHGQEPSTTDNSPFVKLAELLGGECGLKVTRSKVRTALGHIDRRKSSVMRSSKGNAKKR